MYAVFEQLCNERGIKPYKVSKDTGVSQTTLSRWKNEGKDPELKVLTKIANYFSVTVDYLLNGELESGHYLNAESLKQAQAMYDDSDMRFLYEAKQKISPAAFNAWRKSLEVIIGSEYGDFDEGC